MKKLNKIVSVIMVLLMVFTAAPVQGFADIELSDWFSIVSSAVGEKNEQTSAGLGLNVSTATTALDNAPIKDKLDFQFIRDKAQADAESFNEMFFGSNTAEIAGAERPAMFMAARPNAVAETEDPEYDIEWSYDEATHTLTISGTGPMEDYSFSEALEFSSQWFSKAAEIEKIVVEEGITYIGAYAFALCINVKEVILPETVTGIGTYAFIYNVKLENIVLPASITKIDEFAFGACWSLKEIVIPDSVVSIGDGVFAYCFDVEKLVLPGSIKNIDNSLFGQLYSLKELVSSLDLGEGVIDLGDLGILGICLEKLVNNSDKTVLNHSIGASFDDIKYARAYAYINSCAHKYELGREVGIDFTLEEAIRDIIIYSNENLGTNYNPDAATEYDAEAIMNSLEEHVVAISYPAFTMVYCNEDSAQHIYCKENLIRHSVIGQAEECVCFEINGKLGKNVTWTFDSETRTLTFDGSGKMDDSNISVYRLIAPYVEKVEFKEGSSITSLVDTAFYNMKKLKEVTLPEGITSIGEQCFYNSGLETINLPASLTSFRTLSWYIGTTPIKEINVADGNDTLISYEGSLYKTIKFSDTEVYYMLLKQPAKKAGSFIENVAGFDSYAFENYTTVSEITIPDSVLAFGYAAFINCHSLETLNIGKTTPLEIDGVKIYPEISEGWIYECNNLRTINVDEDNETLASVDGVLYDKEITQLVVSPAGKTAVVLPETVALVAEGTGLNSGKLAEVKFLNPDCNIYNSPSTINPGAVIYGYKNSTAEDYADKYLRAFEYIGDITIESVVVDTTNAKTVFNQFESIDLSGLSATVTYSDGTTAVKTSGFKVVEYDFSDMGTTQVTIEYRGVTAQYEVTVSCKQIYPDSYSSMSVELHKGKATYVKYIPENTGSYKLYLNYSESFKITVAVYDSSMNKLAEQTFAENQVLNFAYDYEAGKTYYISISTDRSYDYSYYWIYFSCNHNYVEEVLSAATCSSEGRSQFTCSVCGHNYTEYINPTAQHTDVNSDNRCDRCSISLACGDGVTWSIDEDGVLTITGAGAITSCPWNTHYYIIKAVVISEGITSVCANAFQNFYNITEVTIPATVTEIGSHAFDYCSKLKTVTFAEGSQLQKIGYGAFQRCYALTEITIPASVTEIGAAVFADSAYGGVAVESGNTAYISEDGILYNKDKTELIHYPRNKEDASFEVPASVKVIHDYAFYSCRNLKALTFAEGSQLQTIGSCAFYYCSSLKDIIIPASVTVIGDSAFYECYNLKTLTFAEGSQLQTIGKYAFEHCDVVEEITIPASVTEIGGGVFRYCYSLTAINVEEGNTAYVSIDGVLYNADVTTLIACPYRLSEVTVPKTVTYIESYAFNYNDAKSVTFLTDSFTFGDGMYFDSDTVIYCHPGSTGESLAFRYGLQVEYLDDVTVESIEIDTENTKLVYEQYESFYTSDVSLIVNYSDGRSVTTTTGFTVSSVSTSEVGTYTVEVTFRGLTAEYEITVDYITVDQDSSTYIRIPAGKTAYVKFVPTDTVPLELRSYYYPNYAITFTVYDSDMNKLDEQVINADESIRFTYNYEAGNTYYIGISMDCEYDNSINIYFNCGHNYKETVINERTCGSNGSSKFDCLVCGYSYTGTTYATAQHTDEDSDNYCDVCSVSLTCGNNITWSIDENGVLTITGEGAITSYPWSRHDDIIKSVVISEGITSICDSAFNWCSSLTEITIPSSVTEIGDSAFYYCSSLTEITIPASVTEIGDSAFNDCYNLKKVNFAVESKLQKIGSRAFQDCYRITEITIPASVTEIGAGAFGNSAYDGIAVDSENTAYMSDGGILYNKDKTELVHYPINKENTSFEVPASVKKIGDYAFYYCDNLKTVTFAEDSQLEVIGICAFYDCDSITKITIPASVTVISDSAFNSCSNLKTVAFAKDSKLWKIGYSAFCYCSSLIEITIPARVTEIGNEAFESCSKLIAINVADENTSYASVDGVLYNANITTLIACPSGLEEVVVPETVTRIQSYAFYNSYVKSITFLTDSFDWGYMYFNSSPVVYCHSGSSGESVASNKGLQVVYIDDVKVESIEIDTENTKTAYTQYSAFKISDVHLIVNYADGTSVTKTSGFTVSGNDTNELGTHTVEVTYKGLTTEYEITVDYITVSCNSSTYIKHSAGKTAYVKYVPDIAGPATLSSSDATDWLRTVVVCDGNMNKLKEQSFAAGENINFTYNCEAGKTYYIGISDTYYGYNFGKMYIYFNGAHNYTSEITTPATHTKEGVETFTCFCGDSYTKPIDKLTGHTYEKEVTAPTCTEQGYTTYTCECGESYVTDYTNTIDHKYISEVTKQPTHLEKGEETFTCVCGKSYKQAIDKLAEHTFEKVVTEPTCTKLGYTTYTCECGYSYTGDYVLNTDHTYTSEVTKQPTHLEKGEETFTCICGKSYKQAIDKLTEHSFEQEITEPTCTERGYTTYTCECGYSYVGNYVKATGHDFNRTVIAPTCTEQGYTIYDCACGETYARDYTSAVGHKHISKVTIQPTHDKDGVETFTCICGDSYIKSIDKLTEHSYEKIITAPTCTKQGYTTYICVCGESYVADYVKETDHSFVGSQCKNCSYDKADRCSCNCHKTGISLIIWKLINFFNKILKRNPICSCGKAHY